MLCSIYTKIEKLSFFVRTIAVNIIRVEFAVIYESNFSNNTQFLVNKTSKLQSF